MKKLRGRIEIQGVYYPIEAATSEAARAALRQCWAGVPGVMFPPPATQQLTAAQLKERGWCELDEAADILGVSDRSARRFLAQRRAQFCTVKTRGRAAMMWRRDEVTALKAAFEPRGEDNSMLIFVSAGDIARLCNTSLRSVFRAAERGVMRTLQIRGHHNTPCRLYCLNDMEARGNGFPKSKKADT